ncbi:hypothetical protein [Paraburkholderia phenoliruptrix]|uniref:Extensin n=2 Tax=Paraburkholderia phenoliruptrix TaxID=252970 RepID=K0DX72_9BURK|nr:hypothetical protein [Paraburkholderia phenoliruptrix]AFT88638.1 hypothetical protein BUPH_01186 [Paraburkholderia phenoliruptrix BR3459a]MDR6418906.1 hypothetical protein [Paraburkholderia phenoliruptrix]CAB4047574.1 hypothetical protein LMG9964_01207 [Paraburkholderia phenoliruptrix]
MTNTGKTLIVGLVLADLVICAYLLYPREEKKSAAAPEAALTAPDVVDSRPAETHVIAGSIVRPGSPETAANANNGSAQNGTKVSRVDVRPSPSSAQMAAPQAAMPAMPAAPAAPATNLANMPAVDMQTQAPLSQVPPAAAQQPMQQQQQAQVQAQQQAQPQRSYARSKTTQHADDSRGHEDLRRHGSNEVGALMTELLVRESAKLDPSLPPPPPTDPVDLNRRSSNPVAAAMTDQLVKESARVAPASGTQKQPGTQ